MSIISENPVSFFEFNFKSDNYNVKFNLEFGAGQDSKINKNDSRMNYNIKDTFKMSELKFSNNNTAFKVVGKEAPIVSKISNIQVYNDDEDYDYDYTYGIGFAIDKENPMYNNNLCSEPYNIERDGKMWHIPANTYSTYKVDQNAKARFQMYLKTAKDRDAILTKEEIEAGVEETTDNTGLFFITIMILEDKKEKEEEEYYSKGVTRGATRSATRSATRGATRGGGDDYDNGRIAYGNRASTTSKVSKLKYVDTEKLIIPFRFKVDKNSDKTNMMGAKDIASAVRVEELQKNLQPVLF